MCIIVKGEFKLSVGLYSLNCITIGFMDQEDQTQKRYKPVLASSLGIIFVSTASIFIRFAQSEASSIVISAARLIIAGIILIPITLRYYRDEFHRLSSSYIRKAILSGLFLALHFALWISSLEFTSVASSVVLVTTTPLWVAILSPLLLKEPVRKLVIIGLIVSMMGGVIVGLGNACVLSGGKLVCQDVLFSNEGMFGNLLALLGAWMAAGYMLMGRQLRKKLSTIPYTALVYGAAALFLLVVVIIRQEPVFSYRPQTYGWLFALGIFPQLLGHSLFNWSLKYVSAAYVSLSLLGEPIGTIILAFLFLNESPTILEGLGAILILIGILIGSLGRTQKANGA
jgi:drug/metabolite transporter (DMT)-like permease